jgi:hypothetical protein
MLGVCMPRPVCIGNSTDLALNHSLCHLPQSAHALWRRRRSRPRGPHSAPSQHGPQDRLHHAMQCHDMSGRALARSNPAGYWRPGCPCRTWANCMRSTI